MLLTRIVLQPNHLTKMLPQRFMLKNIKFAIFTIKNINIYSIIFQTRCCIQSYILHITQKTDEKIVIAIKFNRLGQRIFLYFFRLSSKKSSQVFTKNMKNKKPLGIHG